MIDVDWDLAPEGAEELVQFESHVTWRKGIKIWCMVQQSWRDYVSDFKAIAKRPTFAESITKTPTQTKTVADAVEWAKGGWQSGALAICVCDGEFYFSDDNLRMRDVVCTRDEFESYVKEQDDKQEYPPLTQSLIDEAEQEGEKWTHITNSGYECKIIVKDPDENYVVVVLCSDGVYRLHDSKSLKPIKPTMTEEQQKMVSKFVARIYTIETSYNLRDEFDKFCNEHDII